MRNHQDKKFKPEPKPFKENKISSIYKVKDESNNDFYAKFFLERKLIELNIFQSTEYNQTVLSDLSDQIFPQHFLEIKYTYSIPQGFIFVTDPYQCTLEEFLKSKVVEEKQALKIFEQIVSSVYSLYMAGFWHRSIRPQHFVKIGNVWKMESMVYNQNYRDANGLESQYLWDSAYQPPEAYEKQDFTEDQLDQMSVWNLGSLLLDILVSHHKLKDKSVLQNYIDRPFSFKAIGVKKEFSKEVGELLSKMLHYNRSQRMTLSELFSNEFVSREIARLNRKGQVRKNKIYVAGKSHLAKTLSMSSQRAQEILTVKGFIKEKEDLQSSIHQTASKNNIHKLDSNKEFLKKIKTLTQNNPEPTKNKHSYQQPNQTLRNSRMVDLLNQTNHREAFEAYKCYYDKCELLLISSQKMEYLRGTISNQSLLLNKYAVTFVALNTMFRMAQSMNRNLNYLNLSPQIWSRFQESNEFKGFKQIINFRKNEGHHLLAPLVQQIKAIPQNERILLKMKEVQKFMEEDYHNTRFPMVKIPYRKILKNAYDSVTRVYNSQKNEELARIGMYISYCMTIDKMYIPQDIPDNFTQYFKWMNVEISTYVAMDSFQEYLDTADKRILISHSIYILKKYFNKE